MGRVHDARVDVADLGEREEVRGVLRAAELVRGRLVDRDSPRTRGGVGLLSGVDLASVEAELLGHGVLLT